MPRFILFLSLMLTPTFGLSTSALADTFLSRQTRVPRVSRVHKALYPELKDRFQKARAAWPIEGLFIRAFKAERVLEVWSKEERGQRRVLVWSWPLCAKSGVLGPKRREGDAQIPEGIYRIERFNPRSRFHLSLGLNYPNARDKARAGDAKPGSDIFIHGDCVSIGCLAIEDGPIERLYLASVLARDQGQTEIPVHLFPCRFADEVCGESLGQHAIDDPESERLWRELKPIYDRFERSARLPKVGVDSKGYRLR